MSTNLERKSESGKTDYKERVEYEGFLYRVAEGIMRIRKAVRDSQPEWYKMYNF